MRINPNKNFYNRPSQIEEIRGKHFLAYEGTETEKRYFEAVLPKYANNIISLIRTGNTEGWSNAKKIVYLLEKLINEDEELFLTAKEISLYLHDYYFTQNELIDKKYIDKYVQKYLSKLNLTNQDKFDYEMTKGLVDFINERISKDFSLKKILDKHLLYNYIEEVSHYVPELDTISLIIDRDIKSLNSIDYNYIINKCIELNIDLYVTTPCFEFWLLLHFTNDFKDDELEKFSNNNLDLNGQTYTYNFLKKYDPKYKKNFIDYNTYVLKLNTAIKNANKFNNDLNSLANNVGTNLPDLFSHK